MPQNTESDSNTPRESENHSASEINKARSRVVHELMSQEIPKVEEHIKNVRRLLTYAIREPTEEDQLETARNILRGYWGEQLGLQLQPNEGEVVYSSSNLNLKTPQLRVVETKEVIGPLTKESILVDHYFNLLSAQISLQEEPPQEEHPQEDPSAEEIVTILDEQSSENAYLEPPRIFEPEIPEQEPSIVAPPEYKDIATQIREAEKTKYLEIPINVTPEIIEDVRLLVLDTAKNFSKEYSRWKSEQKANRDGTYHSVDLKTLVYWRAKRDIPTYNKTYKKLITGAFDYASKDLHQDTGQIIVRALKNKPTPYEEIAVPDGLLVETSEMAIPGESGKNVIGSVEVKAYKQAEVEEWIAALRRVPAYLQNRDELDYIRNSLQIFTTLDPEVKKPVLMNLGVNVDGERKFMSLVNVTPSEQEYPVLIRFPSNIQNTSLTELGELAEKLGIKNIIIQKIPFTDAQIHQLANDFMIHKIIPSLDPHNNTALHQLAEKLTKKEAWE